MNKTIITIIFAAALSGLSAAPIFGQCETGVPDLNLGEYLGGAKAAPPAGAGKTAQSIKPVVTAPVQTLSIKSKTANGKSVVVQIAPSVLNGLKIGSTYWDDNNRALFVRVDNESTALASPPSVLTLALSYNQMMPSYQSGGGIMPGGTMTKKCVVQTIYKNQQSIAALEAKNGKSFQPGRSAIFYFDFKDFKGDAKELTSIFEYVPPSQAAKQLYLTMKILPTQSKNK